MRNVNSVLERRLFPAICFLSLLSLVQAQRYIPAQPSCDRMAGNFVDPHNSTYAIEVNYNRYDSNFFQRLVDGLCGLRPSDANVTGMVSQLIACLGNNQLRCPQSWCSNDAGVRLFASNSIGTEAISNATLALLQCLHDELESPLDFSTVTIFLLAGGGLAVVAILIYLFKFLRNANTNPMQEQAEVSQPLVLRG